jgi:hypothetical protein
MSRPPNYYAPLRETERQVSEALTRQQEPEPERPERQVHPGAERGWTDQGGMVEQQASAIEWVRASHEQRVATAAAAEQKPEPVVERTAEVTDARQTTAEVEMTDKMQVQYDRWTGQLLDAMQTIEQSRDGGQSRSR